MQRGLTLLSLAALALAACGSGDDDVTIENAWARTTAAGQTTGAIYFDLTVAEDDTLVGASVPASVAADAQVHEVVMADMSGDDMSGDEMSGDMSGDEMSGDEMSGDDMSGAMTMRELTDGLPLTGGETVAFEPGGYHIMLIDVAQPLEVGDEIELTLDFANADDQTITVEVAESAP
jgi:copper(I)-binding protein